MAWVIWLPQALNDLEAIWLFIARESEERADSVSARISMAAARLSDFPESGRMVPEFGRRDIRELLVGNYRLLYRLNHNDVEIISVIHGSRRINSLDLS